MADLLRKRRFVGLNTYISPGFLGSIQIGDVCPYISVQLDLENTVFFALTSLVLISGDAFSRNFCVLGSYLSLKSAMQKFEAAV